MSIRVKLPDSMKVPLPVGNTIDLQITVMSDGRRVATDLSPGPDMTAAMPMIQGIRIHAMYALGGDSLHAGILLPPALAGGAPGYRVDVALTSSIRCAAPAVTCWTPSARSSQIRLPR